MKFNRTLALTILVHVVGVPAQGLPDERGDPPSLGTVTVNARRSLEQRFFSAGSLVVVDRKDIEEIGAFSVADVLRQLPGTIVTTAGDGSVEIRMRGMDRNATQILIDGQRVSTNRSQLPLDQLPAEVIERVEVIRAPTAEFAGATGGTINLVLRQASIKRETSIRVTNNNVWGRNALQTFFSRTGPIGDVKNQDSDGVVPDEGHSALTAEPWAYSISLSNLGQIIGSDTHRNAQDSSGTTVTDSSGRYRRKDIAFIPRVSGKLGAVDQISLRGTYNNSMLAGALDANGLTPGTASSVVPFRSSERYIFDRDYLQGAIDWTHRLEDSKLETTVSASRAREAVDRNGTTPAPSTFGLSSIPLSVHDDRLESLWTVSSKLTGTRNALLWNLGGLIENRKLDVFNRTPSTSLNLSIDMERYALWGQNEWDLSGNTLTLGLRGETLVIKNGTSSTLLAKRRSSFLQPSLHLRIPVDDGSQFRANIARVSRNPRVWDLIDRTMVSYGANSLVNPDTTGNPNLKEETSWTFDFGYEQSLPTQGQAGVNLFARRLSDAIASETFRSDNRWIERRVNAGDAIVWGVELDAKMGLVWAGLGKDWTLAANASLLQSRMTSGDSIGSRIAGQPRYTANITIARPVRRDGGLFGGGTLSVAGPMEFNTSPGVTGRERARAVLDLYVGNVHRGLGYWRIGIFNVGDASLQRRRSYTDTSGQIRVNTSKMNLTPRLYLTIGSQF